MRPPGQIYKIYLLASLVWRQNFHTVELLFNVINAVLLCGVILDFARKGVLLILVSGQGWPNENGYFHTFPKEHC